MRVRVLVTDTVSRVVSTQSRLSLFFSCDFEFLALTFICEPLLPLMKRGPLATTPAIIVPLRELMPIQILNDHLVSSLMYIFLFPRGPTCPLMVRRGRVEIYGSYGSYGGHE